MQANSSGVEFITTISKFRKRKFLHRLVTSSLKYKIRHFHVVVEKERQKIYKKAWCCFAYSTYRFFDIFVLVAIVEMCVLSLSCFLGLPILGFRHVTRRSCSSTKQYNSPHPPTPLNLYKKSYVARGANRWICSCHPTWSHERQQTIKLRSKGKPKAQGAVYVSKMLRPTFPYQRYLAPFMMVNRPARGLQLKKKQTSNKTLGTNYWASKGPNQRNRRRRTQWTNPKEGNDQMTQKLKRRLRQLCLAILDLHN